MRIIKALLSASVFPVFSFSQALAAPPGPPGAHLDVTEVFVDGTSIMIIGTDLDFGSGPLSVTLGEFGALTITGTPTDTLIEAMLPIGILDGDYLLTVSNGNGQSQNDEYDLTIGAVGPQGEQGIQGAPGVSDYERVSAISTNTSGSQKAANVSCPGSKKVLGGGFGIIDTNTAAPFNPPQEMQKIGILTNQPSSDTGWVALAVGFQSEGAPAPNKWNVIAFAVCATVAP